MMAKWNVGVQTLMFSSYNISISISTHVKNPSSVHVTVYALLHIFKAPLAVNKLHFRQVVTIVNFH